MRNDSKMPHSVTNGNNYYSSVTYDLYQLVYL